MMTSGALPLRTAPGVSHRRDRRDLPDRNRSDRESSAGGSAGGRSSGGQSSGGQSSGGQRVGKRASFDELLPQLFLFPLLTQHDLIQQADLAMREVKKGGKNAIGISEIAGGDDGG